MSTETSTYTKYKVKDINLADWGRKEIHLAEAEMPGLMSFCNRARRLSKPMGNLRKNI